MDCSFKHVSLQQDSKMDLSHQEPSVRHFFKDKTIFLTGATGFLGKFIVEKILTTCHVKRIYFLLREKKGLTVQQRLETYKDDQIFKFRTDPKALEVLTPIHGDITVEGLGIADEWRQTLIDEVDIVIHSAATVKFDEDLSVAMTINVLGTMQMMELCRKMTKLKSFVYVSTAFTACHLDKIGEDFDTPVADPYYVMQLLETQDEHTFNTVTCEKIKGGHPNTYTFTKSLSESLVRDQATKHSIPTAIARPAIISCPSKEPISCYVDALSQGAAALVANVGMGLNRILPGDPHNTMPGIPVDKVANSILVIAWETGNDFLNNNYNGSPIIYGVYNTTNNQTTLGLLSRVVSRSAQNFPSIRSIRPPKRVTFDMRFDFFHKLKVLYFNVLFAQIFDTIIKVTGQKPRLVRAMDKSIVSFKLLRFFMLRDWHVDGKNINRALDRLSLEERNIFDCDMSKTNHDWIKYYENYWLGIRKWALKEDISNLNQAQLRLTNVTRLYYVVMSLAAVTLIFSSLFAVKHLLSLIDLLMGSYGFATSAISSHVTH